MKVFKKSDALLLVSLYAMIFCCIVAITHYLPTSAVVEKDPHCEPATVPEDKEGG